MSAAVLGLGLSAVAATATNAAYVVQHSALAGTARLGSRATRTLGTLLSSRRWVVGAALGYAGLGAQIGALALVPLWTVQAVMASGLLVALGGWARREQRPAGRRLNVAAGLLGVGLLTVLVAGDHGAPPSAMPVGGLALFLAAVTWAGLACPRLIGRPAGPATDALVAGLLYGATTTALAGAVTTVATVSAQAAAALTAGGLLAVAGLVRFQRALQGGDPMTVVLLMSVTMNATAMLGGVLLSAGSAPSLLAAAGLTALCGAGVVAASAQARQGYAMADAQPPRGRGSLIRS